ncbi:MAG: hypothetical protein J5636_10420 [Clostridiales bacterium]|nr:hypothetical protein [Clostridiales bacterium]
MAKILKNENESPEVDLKNLTVKLAGMGLDEEIDDMIPGKKEKESEEASDEGADTDEETETEEVSEETSSEGEDLDQSEEVVEFYEKRAAERDLTLDKVEALAEEMESSDSDKKQKVGVLNTVIGKPEKKNEKDEEGTEKKKAHFDAVAICGIVAAILALIGGGIYIFFQVYEEPNLGVSEQEFRLHYYETAIYKSIIGYGFAMPIPQYRDEKPETTSGSDAAGETTTQASYAIDPTAITTVEKSKYRYFEGVMSNALSLPIFITGVECRNNNLLKQIRFFAPCSGDEDEMRTIKVAYAAFLQAFYVGEDSQVCADKIKNAYDQSVASADAAVMIKDGDIAYAVSYNAIDGVPCLVLDVVPAKEADKFVFNNSVLPQ